MFMHKAKATEAPQMSDGQIQIIDAFEGVSTEEIESGVLRKVKLLGLKSKNGRNYNTEGVRKTAKSALEGARVYVDHPDKPSAVRSYREAFGFTEAVEYVEGKGWYGTLKFNPAHPSASQFIWDVKNKPTALGMSINGRIKQAARRNGDGDVVVEAIEEIRSVDLVTRPATASGIFESESTQMKLEELSADAVEALKAQVRADLAKEGQQSAEAQEAEKARKELAELKAVLAKKEAEESARKIAGEVTESLKKTFEKVTLPDGVLTDLVECACQMKEESRKSFVGALEKLSPMLRVTTDEEDDATDESGEAPAEESHKEKPAVPAKVGGGSQKKKTGSLDLRASLGLKSST